MEEKPPTIKNPNSISPGRWQMSPELWEAYKSLPKTQSPFSKTIYIPEKGVDELAANLSNVEDKKASLKEAAQQLYNIKNHLLWNALVRLHTTAHHQNLIQENREMSPIWAITKNRCPGCTAESLILLGHRVWLEYKNKLLGDLRSSNVERKQAAYNEWLSLDKQNGPSIILQRLGEDTVSQLAKQVLEEQSDFRRPTK